MSLIVYGIPNCDTVKKARVWLDAHGIAFTFHDYKKAGIDAAKLRSWCTDMGWSVILNRSGKTESVPVDQLLPEMTKARNRIAELTAEIAKYDQSPFSVNETPR